MPNPKKHSSNSYVWFFLAAVLIFAGYIYFQNETAAPAPGQYDAFAKCLAEKNVVMYGEVSCPFCQRQKADFGSAFRYVPYVECPENPQLCVAKGIEGYPTWIFPDGKKLVGLQPMEKLAEQSGCELPK